VAKQKLSWLSDIQIPLLEIWRPIPGFPQYQVSSEGRVRTRFGRVLKTHEVKGGYERVGLTAVSGRRRNFLVHRLVTLAFYGPCPQGMEVNHENGHVYDNALRNLEYVTPRQNVQHSLKVLGRRRAAGECHGNAVLTNKQVLELRLAWASGLYKTKRSLAARFGISVYVCGDILNGKTWRSVA
jgi:hypothetical protein